MCSISHPLVFSSMSQTQIDIQIPENFKFWTSICKCTKGHMGGGGMGKSMTNFIGDPGEKLIKNEIGRRM